MEQLGAQRPHIAAIGPMIRQNNCEVGDELVAKFTGSGFRQQIVLRAGIPRSGHADVRSGRLCRQPTCKQAGVAYDDLGLCTYERADGAFL